MIGQTETIRERFTEIRNYVKENEQELRKRHGENYVAILYEDEQALRKRLGADYRFIEYLYANRNCQVVGSGEDKIGLWLEVNKNSSPRNWAFVRTINGFLKEAA